MSVRGIDFVDSARGPPRVHRGGGIQVFSPLSNTVRVWRIEVQPETFILELECTDGENTSKAAFCCLLPFSKKLAHCRARVKKMMLQYAGHNSLSFGPFPLIFGSFFSQKDSLGCHVQHIRIY